MTIPDQLDWKPLERKIGSGGQGTVHLVYHKNDPDKTPRALKILNKNSSQEARRRFQKEIKTLRKIDHPAIIKVLDYSPQDAEFQFLVMKYHIGAKTIEEVCLSPDPNPFHGNTLKCLDLFEQIILGIQVCELSSDPICHRDISPRNILILPDDSIRLIDFGLCHTVGDSTITMTGQNVGTRSYAPPECGAFSQFTTGTHTDIFSAAKVLWSAITSKRVFDRPVIGENTSMKNMFPDKVETWHLGRLFENTIQEDPADRFDRTELVLLQIDEIRHAVKGGFPPVETAHTRCPSCGLRSIRTGSNPHHLFGNFTVGQYIMSECSECGFVVIRRFTQP